MARSVRPVALLGTLHAKHGEQSVHRINLTLTRERDRSTHGFEWLAFRGRMAMTDKGNAPMEFPTTILVAPLQPARYHILFVDRDLRYEFLQDGQQLNREWIDYWRSKSTINPDGTIAAADVEATFNQFFCRRPFAAALQLVRQNLLLATRNVLASYANC